jgi:hypothetical protein
VHKEIQDDYTARNPSTRVSACDSRLHKITQGKRVRPYPVNHTRVQNKIPQLHKITQEDSYHP